MFMNSCLANHCFKPCPLNGPMPCLIHSQHFSYCLYGHFLHNQDPTQCTFCSTFGKWGIWFTFLCRAEMFPKYKASWDAFPEEKKAAFQNHFNTCAVVLFVDINCRAVGSVSSLIWNRMMGPSFSRIFDEREWLVASLNYFSMNRDYREESRGSENNLVEVPTSLFYTSETEEAESHTGYLRIIPVKSWKRCGGVWWLPRTGEGMNGWVFSL